MRVAIVGVVVLTLVAGIASGAHAQPPPAPRAADTGGAASVGAGVPGADPGGVVRPEDDPPFWDIPGRIDAWFRRLVASAVGPVFSLLGQTLFSTPDVTTHPRVRALWRLSLFIADAAMVLFVIGGAGVVTVEGGYGARLSAKELLPRTLFAVAAANLSLLILGQMISISNVLARAMLGVNDDPAAVAGRIADRLVVSFSNPFLVLFVIVVIVLAILVVATYVLRLAAMVVLAASAPLVLVTHTLPQSDGIARAWWRVALALLAAPVLQSMLLAATLEVFLTGGGVLGFSLYDVSESEPNFVDLLVIACLLYALAKVPLWSLRGAFGSGASRTWSKARSYASSAVKAVLA
ncbi:MAG: hypothetical protein ACRDJ4_12040 [Actinomycetota bacterium]